MSTLSHCRMIFPLVAVFLGVQSGPAHGDEFRFLPDNAQIIVSVDLSKALKSRTYQKILENLPRAKDDPHVKALAKFARLTTATHVKDRGRDEVVVMTADKTITADEVKAMTGIAPFQKKFAFKEIKHGSFVIYQETYHLQFNADDPIDPIPIEGQAFCIVEKKYVVKAKLPTLKKIVDRGKPAELSAAVQAGLKDADVGNGVSLVVDVQKLPVKARESLFLAQSKFTSAPDIKAHLGKVQTLAVKMNESDKVKLQLTLLCGEPARIKGIVEKTLADINDNWKDLPRPPAGLEQTYAELKTSFKAVEATSSADRVTLRMDMEPAGGVFVVFYWLMLPVDLDLDLDIDAPKAPAPRESPEQPR